MLTCKQSCIIAIYDMVWLCITHRASPTGISTALLPLIALVPEHSVALASVLRCITGIAQGPLYPSWGVLAATWLNVDERGFWAGAFSAGSAFGIVVAWVAGPHLMEAAAAHMGWKVCFYGAAGLGLPWAVCWFLFTSSYPPPPPPTSAAGKQRLSSLLKDIADVESTSNTAAAAPAVPTPWRAILTSPGMNAGYVTNFGCGWIFYMLLSFLPQYLEQRFNFNLQTSGVFAELPYIGRAVVLFGGGFAADMMLRKKMASLLTVRRIFNTLASIGPALFLMGVTFTFPVVGHENSEEVKFLVIGLIIAGVGISGCQMQGCVLVPVDLFPEASGVAYVHFLFVLVNARPCWWYSPPSPLSFSLSLSQYRRDAARNLISVLSRGWTLLYLILYSICMLTTVRRN